LEEVNMQKFFTAMFIASVAATSALAGEADLTINTYSLNSITIIGTATGGHIPGNMEVHLVPALALPRTVSCDPSYITTRQTVDPNRTMTGWLRDAMVQPTIYIVHVRITDNPSYNAFPGRCSLEFVTLQYNPFQ
jgi:hypothetical protein